MKAKYLVAGAALALVAASSNAAIVTVNYVLGYHIGPWLTAGSNGASNNVVYGDGGNGGVPAQQFCVNGNTVDPDNNPIANPRSCNDYNVGGAINQTVTFVGNGGGTAVAGNNGAYWSVNATTPLPNPDAHYVGTLQFDDSIIVSYTDKITNVTENYYKVVGGSLTWTGTVGFEVVVNPSATSGAIGGSFFSYSWTNSNVNLVTGARGGGARCDLGMAGAVIVGAILCGGANPASGFAYNSVGAYVNGDWALIKDLGGGAYELVMRGNRRTDTGAGNDLQERLYLSTVPVPGAVWLLGSALGLLGWMRRKTITC